MSRTSKYYDPNSPQNLARSIAVTERKLKELHLREEIALLDRKLEALNKMKNLYPPHRADGEQPFALHTAAFPS